MVETQNVEFETNNNNKNDNNHMKITHPGENFDQNMVLRTSAYPVLFTAIAAVILVTLMTVHVSQWFLFDFTVQHA